MWDFIKGLFKFLLSFTAITTLVVGVVVVVFGFIFKKTLKISKEKQKKSYLILKAIMLNATMYHIPVISFEVTGFLLLLNKYN